MFDTARSQRRAFETSTENYRISMGAPSFEVENFSLM